MIERNPLMNNITILVSDLHLSDDTPQLNNIFRRALHQWCGKIDALYILGDLFEYWIGDDFRNELTEAFFHELKQFSQQTPLYVMHGNRDFLLGQAFCEATGAVLIEDPSMVTLYEQEYVLSHGDLLCTDDLPYQQFRAQSRNPMWQKMMLDKPINERKVLAMQLRQMSEGVKQTNGKTDISDATEKGVLDMISPFAQGKDKIPTLIHGHTHRPAVHEHEFEDKTFKRYVLQDWSGNKGGYLEITSVGVEIKNIP